MYVHVHGVYVHVHGVYVHVHGMYVQLCEIPGVVFLCLVTLNYDQNPLSVVLL